MIAAGTMTDQPGANQSRIKGGIYGSSPASPVLRTCGGVGLIGLGLIETWLSCCAGVAWGLGASRGASTHDPDQDRAGNQPATARPAWRSCWGRCRWWPSFGQRLDLAGIVDRACPVREVATLTHGQVICALVANRLTSPTPLWRVEDWAQGVGGRRGLRDPPEALNDDRIGRALDAIAPKLDAIVGSVGAQAIAAFGAGGRAAALGHDLDLAVRRLRGSRGRLRGPPVRASQGPPPRPQAGPDRPWGQR